MMSGWRVTVFLSCALPLSVPRRPPLFSRDESLKDEQAVRASLLFRLQVGPEDLAESWSRPIDEESTQLVGSTGPRTEEDISFFPPRFELPARRPVPPIGSYRPPSRT